MATLEQEPCSFPRLMSLHKIDDNTYRAKIPAWGPGAGYTAFGGHVYAQSAWAAAQTVKEGMTIHNITGHFILPGQLSHPFTYYVRRIRDGGVYSVRSVDTYQDPSITFNTFLSQSSTTSQHAPRPGLTPSFTATISFKRLEPNTAPDSPFLPVRHQTLPADHVRRTYASDLRGKDPSTYPLTWGADAEWWPLVEAQQRAAVEKAVAKGGHRRPFHSTCPGIEIRKPDLSSYNASHQVVPPIADPLTTHNNVLPGAFRQLHFYRMYLPTSLASLTREERQSLRDPNLHAAAHLYASDRNGLFMVQRALGYAEKLVPMGSLSHTVVLHSSSGPAEEMNACMLDEGGRPRWFVQEMWTAGSGDGRGLHESRLWEWDAASGESGGDKMKGGRVIGTTLQEGMVRLPRGELDRSEEGMERVRSKRRDIGLKL